MWKSVIERVERKWIPLPLVPADMNQPLVKSMWLCRDRMKTRFPMEKDTGADIGHLDFFADTNQRRRMVCVDSVETE